METHFRKHRIMKADSDVKNVLVEDGLPKEALATFHQYENQTTVNIETLRKELAAIGVILPSEKNAIMVSDTNLFLDIDEKDSDKVIEVLKNHNGNDIVIETTIEQKLASVGLSIDDLKSALGL